MRALLPLLLLLSACATTGHDAVIGVTESARLTAWLDARYEEELRMSPMQLTMLGRKELNDRFDDFSLDGLKRRIEWQGFTVNEMQRHFHYDRLDDDAKLSWDLWIARYERAKASRAYWLNAYPFEQMGGLQSSLPTFLIAFHAVDTEADYQAYLKRLERLPRVIDQLLDRVRASARQNIRPPRFAQEAVIEQARKVIEGAPFTAGNDSALWADLQAKVDGLVTKGAITPSQTDDLKEAGRAALLHHVAPAYGSILRWFEADLPKALVNPRGVGSTQANGAAYYAYQLRQNTTTGMTAAEIHELGLQEVARLHAEMEAVKLKTGFTGTLAEFFKLLDSGDPRFVFPNTDAGRQAYLDAATAAIDTIRQQLPRYFGLLPRAELVVKRVEPYREQPGAVQHYYPGTPDGSRPGIYYAHLIDMHAMPRTELEVVAYHEGIPGHHMQISIAQELTDIPKFRRQSEYTAYVEGWGLYAEWLAKQMPGTYQDPYSEFGRLTSENWRAIRLVVDTGLHAMGWTEEQAFDYFIRHSPQASAAVRSEVRRYVVWPGQATAYKIGMLKIQELRRKAENALGPRFDIRGFHDTILGGGALPLDLLERKVDRWIESVPR